MNTTYWLNKIMDTMYTSASSEFWVGLSSTLPNQAGTGVSEPSGGNYARVQLTEFTSPVDGTIKNVSALEFNRSTSVWFDSDHKANIGCCLMEAAKWRSCFPAASLTSQRRLKATHLLP